MNAKCLLNFHMVQCSTRLLEVMRYRGSKKGHAGCSMQGEGARSGMNRVPLSLVWYTQFWQSRRTWNLKGRIKRFETATQMTRELDTPSCQETFG